MKNKYYTVEAEYSNGRNTRPVDFKTKTKAYSLQDVLMGLDDVKSVTVELYTYHHYKEAWQMSSNLKYCSKKLNEEVETILNSESVHFFAKEIIRLGLDKDCVDAVSDVQLALNLLRKVQEECLS
jgi:hypothetical protein